MIHTIQTQPHKNVCSSVHVCAHTHTHIRTDKDATTVKSLQL